VETNPSQASPGKAVTADAPSDIIANDCWVEVTQRYRPKTNLFTVLTVLWLFPTTGAVVIVALNAPRWFGSESLAEAFRAIGFEQWIALGLIAAHPVFAWLAWRYRRIEPFREQVVSMPNPEIDSGRTY